MEKKFVAINYINCEPHYRERFEELFASRARAIDRMPGFVDMQVLRPNGEGEYLIVSHWASEEAFKTWKTSTELLEGNKRCFDDIRKAREQGLKPPMSSSFKTYEVIAK